MYGKIIDGQLYQAPNPVKFNGYWIGNPKLELLLSLGYKPVVFTDPPDPISETGWWTDTWTEDEEKITQGWTWCEPEEANSYTV